MHLERNAALCIVLVSSLARGAEWNTGPGGNPSRNGLTTETGPRIGSILWQGSLPTAFAQQGVVGGDGAGGDVVVVSRTQNIGDTLNGTTIVAHDLTTGAVRWTRPGSAPGLPIDFPATDWRARVTGVRDGVVYATRAGNTNSSFLYALRANDGAHLWRSQALITESTTEGVTFAPDGDIITTGMNALVRINREDGLTVWSIPRSCPTSGGCDASVYAPADRLYFWEAGAQGPVVTAFRLSTGQRLYSTPGIGGGFIQQNCLFVGADGTVYAPRTQNNAASDFFVAFTDTGAGFVEKWRVPQGFVAFGSYGVGPDGTVYTYNPAREIVRLNPATGAVVSTSPFSINGQFNSPRMAIDRLGRLFVTNPDASGGTLWSFNADLTLRWSAPISNVNVGGPAIGRGGALAVFGAGSDLRVYAAPCSGDTNGDGLVNFADLNTVLAQFGQAPPQTGPTGDVNGDGAVSFADLNIVLARFGLAC